MDEPVGVSFLGGLMIVAAAGILGGLLARLLRGTSTVRTLFDMGLGTLGSFVVIFLLPMKGFTLGNIIGWPAATAVGALLPIVACHWLLLPRLDGSDWPPRK